MAKDESKPAKGEKPKYNDPSEKPKYNDPNKDKPVRTK